VEPGLLQDGYSLTEAACSGQNCNMCGQLKSSMGLVAFPVVLGQHKMDIECWVVGSGGIICEVEMILWVFLMVIELHGV